MNLSRTIACLSLASVIASCTPAGYYDSNGEYRSYGSSDSFRHENAMAGTPVSHAYPDTTYDRAGYYDRNGYYIARDNGPRVSDELFPPRGMCRIWFADRPADDQPRVESCNGIRSRVPAGAYVIYGG